MHDFWFWVEFKQPIQLNSKPKIVHDIANPEIKNPICCVNFFYEYKAMLIGKTCI